MYDEGSANKKHFKLALLEVELERSHDYNDVITVILKSPASKFYFVRSSDAVLSYIRHRLTTQNAMSL